MPKLRNQLQKKFKALKPTSTENTDNSAVVGMKLQIASHLRAWRRPPRLGHRCVQKIITNYWPRVVHEHNGKAEISSSKLPCEFFKNSKHLAYSDKMREHAHFRSY
jgi:hypothetical protein